MSLTRIHDFAFFLDDLDDLQNFAVRVTLQAQVGVGDRVHVEVMVGVGVLEPEPLP